MNEKMQGHAWEVDGHKVQCLTCGMVQTQETAGTKCGVYPLEPTPPASHDAGEAAPVFEVGFGWLAGSCDLGHIPNGTKLYHERTVATLTAEVSRLTVELAEAREIIDGYRAQSLRYKASMDECERLRACALDYLDCLGFIDNGKKLAKDLAALSASGREGE